MTDTITPLNYTEQAIKNISHMEKGLRQNAPYTSYVMRQVVDMLHNSIKFILPNCCDIIEPDEFRQAHFDLAHLPYPIVTFEIPWVKENVETKIGDFEVSKSSKRIALCWESKPDFEPVPGCNAILKTYEGGGVFILPVSWSDKAQEWVLGIGGMFYPYDNQLTKYKPDEILPASKIVRDALIEDGYSTNNSAQFKAEPFIACPDFADEMIKLAGSREQLYAQIIMDCRDELQAFIQACSVLNCENVQPVTLSRNPAKKFINGRRVKSPEKSKLPAYTYKVLQLSDIKTQSSATGKSGTGGTKRMHLRRGHIRRRDEKLIWVRPAMINANSEMGIVDKDYQLKTDK